MTAELPFGYEVEDGVATITLDRPERAQRADVRGLPQAHGPCSTSCAPSPTSRSVVITGAGQGLLRRRRRRRHHRQAVRARHEATSIEFTRMTGELIENIRRLDRPVIAAINGPTAGAGAVIAAGVRTSAIMAENAKIHFLFTKVGLTGADMGAAWLLPRRRSGSSRATAWLMLGDGVEGGGEALGIGIRARRSCRRTRCWARRRRSRARLADGPTLALSHDEADAQQRGFHMDLADGHRDRGPRAGDPAPGQGPSQDRSTTRSDQGCRAARVHGALMPGFADQVTEYEYALDRRGRRGLAASRGRSVRDARSRRAGRAARTTARGSFSRRAVVTKLGASGLLAAPRYPKALGGGGASTLAA